MPTLMDAYNNVVGVLKPQKQGTCGLYSFWFATLLLNSIRTTQKQVVYPRGCEGMPASGLSLRKYAKQTHGSGQGELLSFDEVAEMILAFGWTFNFYGDGGDRRKVFVTASLAQNMPVMFSYLAGGSSYGGTVLVMPQTAIPPNRACGPHWSLIIGEYNDLYYFVEPNQPLMIKCDFKDRILRSNEMVDSFVMEGVWVKPTTSVHGNATVQPASAGLTADQIKKTYHVKVDGRQALNNLMFAIN